MNGALVPTLPRSAYVDEGAWQAERERIFARQWVLAGRESDVAAAGDFLRTDVAGESVIVVRRDDGELGGFYNVCRHRGAELVDTCGGASERFVRRAHPLPVPLVDLRARRCAAPHPVHADPRHWTSTSRSRSTRSASTRGAGSCSSTSRRPRRGPLLDQLGAMVDRVRRYPLAELRSGATFTYDVACNWKVIAENYNECYHCAPVHPELCDLVPAFRRGGAELGWVDGIPLREGAWTFTSHRHVGAGAVRRPRRGRAPTPQGRAGLPQPAAEHVGRTRRGVQPAAARTGRAHVVCDLLFHPDEIARATFDPSDAGDLWDIVNRQDWAICESVQRGMTSRAWTGGWFAPMEDESADISRWYADVDGRATGSGSTRSWSRRRADDGLADGLDDG